MLLLAVRMANSENLFGPGGEAPFAGGTNLLGRSKLLFSRDFLALGNPG